MKVHRVEIYIVECPECSGSFEPPICVEGEIESCWSETVEVDCPYCCEIIEITGEEK